MANGALWLNKSNKIYRIFLLLIISFNFYHYADAQNFDINGLKSIHVNRNQNLDGMFQQISNSVYYLPFAQTASLYTVGLIKRNKTYQSEAIEQVIALGVNGVITYTLKRAFNRPRPVVSYPFLKPLEPLTKYSFPSGHTSMAFYNATIWSLQCKKWYVTAPSFLWASAVGYSRMHMGVHYPTDVIAGAVTGTASAFIGQRIHQFIQRHHTSKNIIIKFYGKKNCHYRC